MNFEEATSNIQANMAIIEAAKPTMQEVASGLMQAAPAIDKAWKEALDDDALWAMRAQKRGRLRTWWLRWRLCHPQKSDT